MAELRAQPVVHDVIHHPQRGLGDPRRERADLDTVELVGSDQRQAPDVNHVLARRARPRTQLPQHLNLKQLQLAVGDDKEVPATAGRVKEGHPPQPPVERSHLAAPPRVPPCLQPSELIPQVVEEQGAEHLQDVPLGRVVCALRPSLLMVHHGLEQRSEDHGRDRGPIEAAGVKEPLPHRRCEARDAQGLLAQRLSDMRKLGYILVERWPALVLGRV